MINTSLPFSGSYTFTAPGVYSVNITVYNHVSTVTQIIPIGINARFENYDFTACYLLPEETNPLNDICDLTMISGFYYVPKQSQLVAYLTWTNPSKIYI